MESKIKEEEGKSMVIGYLTSRMCWLVACWLLVGRLGFVCWLVGWLVVVLLDDHAVGQVLGVVLEELRSGTRAVGELQLLQIL